MIASLHGPVTHASTGSVVIDVGGMGIRALTTVSTSAKARPGHDMQLATSLVVREDSLTLYGFLSDVERDTFEILQTVSGVGPRLALAILDAHAPAELQRIVAMKDIAKMTQVSGVGQKGAQRLVLELSGKLDGITGTTVAATADTASEDHTDEVVEALVGLGWPARQARENVEIVLKEQGKDLVAAGDVPEVLRSTLRILGAQRG